MIRLLHTFTYKDSKKFHKLYVKMGKYKRISVVEDKRHEGLVDNLEQIAEKEQISFSALVKKALSIFTKEYNSKAQ